MAIDFHKGIYCNSCGNPICPRCYSCMSRWGWFEDPDELIEYWICGNEDECNWSAESIKVFPKRVRV